MQESKIYTSLLYKNHIFGIPLEWFLGSCIIVLVFFFPFSILGAFIGLVFLSYIGRFIAIYYDYQFARILFLKYRTTSFNSNQYFHITKNPISSISILSEPIKIMIEKTKFRKIISLITAIKKIFPKLYIGATTIYNIRSLEYLPIKNIEDGILVHNNKSISIFLELKGIDDTTLNLSDENIFNTKLSFINSISPTISISYYFIRKAQTIKKDEYKIKNNASNEVNKAWLDSFQYEYSNKYYLKITKANDIISKVSSTKNIKKNLLYIAQSIKKSLSMYSVKIVEESSELGEIIQTLLGGYPCQIQSKKIDKDSLYNNPFKINGYAKTSLGKFSTFLNIKQFHTNQLDSELFKSITQQDFETIFYCHINNKPPQKQKEIINAKKHHNQSANKDSDEVVAEMEEIISGIESGRLKIIDAHLGIQIFGKDQEELEKNINILIELFQIYSIQLQNEMGIFLGYYYSILEPVLHPRKIQITTENFATIFNPTRIVRGAKENPWGNYPMSTFYNKGNSIYHFNLHSEAKVEDMPAGHTLAIGATGCGKTVFINFLLSQILKYEDMKIFSIDSLRGQFIFTTAHEGKYRDLNQEGMQLNPFDMEKSEENSNFLSKFFEIMLDANGEERKKIDNAISSIAGQKEANLLEFSKVLSKNNSTLSDKIKQWTTGIYKGHFNGKKRLKLNSIECFNMTAIMTNTKLVALYSLYFYHQFMLQNKGKKGVVFFDELKSYLDTSLGDLFLSLTEQARKNNKIVIGALQSINQINIPIGKMIIDNISTFILYPIGEKLNPETIKLYRDLLGLNDKEISFLSNTNYSSREVLIKKNNHSVIINVDLSYLGDHLKIFDSNQEKTNILQRILEAV